MINVILGEYDDKNKCKKDSKNFSNIYNDNVLMLYGTSCNESPFTIFHFNLIFYILLIFIYNNKLFNTYNKFLNNYQIFTCRNNQFIFATY